MKSVAPFPYFPTFPHPLIGVDPAVEDYELPRYSKGAVKRAGKMLARDIPLSKAHDAIEDFRIAHNWRAACEYPMSMMRRDLAGKVRRGGGGGITAGRLKRMHSIRKKLKAGSTNLREMQDIAACRAILPDMHSVRRLSAYYDAGNTTHRLRRKTDYIATPKDGGYRSTHFIYEYVPVSDIDEAFAGMRIEVQLRTALQHAWATALETIDFITRQDLKAGSGTEDWERLLCLMSALLHGSARGRIFPLPR